jgi:tetratricopeptide (TPR) repeat protein
LLFGFILRAAMVLQFKARISKKLLSMVVFLVCGLAGTDVTLAQRLPKATGREPENKPGPSRREGRHKRQTAQAASSTPASIESGNFFDLGERFREQKKLKAAEAAYREAVKVWPGNVDALLELGFLYVDTNRMDAAQQTYSELRSLNSSFAANLLAEINKRKASLAH